MFSLNLYLRYRSPRQRGPLRRLLGLLGPTWLASPWRRLLQTASFGLFVGLLFYVAWPYTAVPARQWSGWMPAEVDAATGQATLAAESKQDAPAVGETVFVSTAVGGQNVSFGAFAVTSTSAEELVVTPRQPLPADKVDQLAGSFAAWTLSARDPATPPSHYIDDLSRKEVIPAETFLALDPLVSFSTAIAARSWVASLTFAAVILAVCLVVPRGFCGYICPLGTLIDLVDRVLGPLREMWCHRREDALPTRAVKPPLSGLKYLVLAVVLGASVCGVVLSGFVAAIPVVTRGLVFLLRPLGTEWARDANQVPPLGFGQWLSLGLFLAILALGLLGPRLWCNRLCPTGAIFSLANFFRLTQREVRSNCIGCGKCVEICSFTAIEPDYSTRPHDCTFCQDCGGACPVQAIQFVGRWSTPHAPREGAVTRSVTSTCASDEPVASRRAFLSTAAGVGVCALGGAATVWPARLTGSAEPPVRPPGSLPEPLFLQKCVRCSACIQACPNDALQPMGFENGFDGLWTPRLAADWSGCEPSCSNCGQVCPTGAIRPLSLDEKRQAHIGRAVVDPQTCLPYAGTEECRLCADECTRAGYHAIEFTRVGTQLDEHGQPVEDSGFAAPVVVADRCVGCGLCQTRCRAVNVLQKELLTRAAIIVEAGTDKEDRLVDGSYIELRQAEAQRRAAPTSPPAGDYLPDFLRTESPP